MNKNLQSLCFVAVLAVSIGILSPSMAKKSTKKLDGNQLFQQNCAGCHAAGENKVDPNHPVAGSKELATLASFKTYLSAPPGHMPYYEHIVNDDSTLKALYNYCKQLKKLPFKQASLPLKQASL